MDYRMISADDHLDLQYLPADLWTARLPQSLRHRAPHVEHRDGGSVWMCDGGLWGRWAGTPRPKGPKPAFNAFDRGGVDESEMRPAKAELSLLPFYGEGHLLWASDYPHPDSTWPNSRRIVDKQMGDLSPAVRRQLTRDNAAALYGL